MLWPRSTSEAESRTIEVMTTTTLKLGSCLCALALVSFGCEQNPEEPAAADTAGSINADSADSPTFILVPPFQGTYDEMWSALRTLDTVMQPVSSASAKQFAEMSSNDGSGTVGDMDLQPMIINLGTAEQESLWLIAYTDGALVQPETYSIMRSPREALLDALYNEHVVGLSFNPYTKVSKQEVFNFNVDKLYIAGLVGYLTATDAEPGRRCQAANAARAKNEPLEALHHALRALDDQEQWSECELAKLWATWELDFPGSRAMADEELEWFIGQGNDTTETRAMLNGFRNASP